MLPPLHKQFALLLVAGDSVRETPGRCCTHAKFRAAVFWRLPPVNALACPAVSRSSRDTRRMLQAPAASSCRSQGRWGPQVPDVLQRSQGQAQGSLGHARPRSRHCVSSAPLLELSAAVFVCRHDRTLVRPMLAALFLSSSHSILISFSLSRARRMQADARGYTGNVFARAHNGGPVDCMSHPGGPGCAGPH